MVNIEKPNTWRKYKKGLCDTCMASCCTLLVEVTTDDMIRLGYTSEWEVDNDLKSLVKSLKKQKIIKRFNDKSKKFLLESLSNGDCQFLNSERRCIVYENRPDVCRKHPEKLSSKIGFCPYLKKVN
ncbi:MAG: YkgJ family cysteine cluster protein [Desulfobacterales bacterium]|nr:YkgJ family cysteine cluster protein [Desulfobacterales bacterium]MCP4162471.1 YkgJ family cysteine cluster protein [Deltaproteobacteria bacterium]